MSKYYYLTASLPMLHLGAPPPLTSREFLEMCERLMSPSDYEQIRLARLNSPEPARCRVDLLRRYQDAELGLRNELVRLRAKTRNVEPDRYVRRDALNPVWMGAAREISEQDTPLKSELLLGEVLWRVVEDLSAGHFFDLDLLAGYYLKLQILERKARFQVETGQQNLVSILSGDKKDG